MLLGRRRSGRLAVLPSSARSALGYLSAPLRRNLLCPRFTTAPPQIGRRLILSIIGSIVYLPRSYIANELGEGDGITGALESLGGHALNMAR